MKNKFKLLPGERIICTTLSLIVATRIFGLFALLPVFSILADSLSGANPARIGVAIGIYGLVQACMHFPCAMLSDRFGRRKVILLAMIVFCAGSLLCALTNDIWFIILGRCLQGFGAIGGVSLAMLADFTRPEVRPYAMMFMGMAIGSSFALSMIVGPVLANLWGISGLFWLTVFLSSIGIILCYKILPKDKISINNFKLSDVKQTICSIKLLPIYITVFLQHGIFAALFYIIPIILQDTFAIPLQEHCYYYLVLLLISFLPLPFLMKNREICTFYCSISRLLLGLFGATCLIFLYKIDIKLFLTGLLLLFLTFNILEAVLPTILSKISDSRYRGSVMGIYSSAQFFGIFCGSLAAGKLYGSFGMELICLLCITILCIWLLLHRILNKRIIEARE